MNKMGAVLISVRFQFLLLAAVCAGLGGALAFRIAGRISWLDALIALIGAACAHAAVNMLNDCHDFKSGLDLLTQRTPFSGGSGAIPQNPQAARAVFLSGMVLLLLTVLCGVWFLWRGRWGIVLPGLFGLLLIVVYTPWITRHPLICLITPGLAFGPLITGGTCYALAGVFPLRVLAISLVPFFLVNNLLLLNQYPDTEPDRAIGRLTMPVWLGFRICSTVYGLFGLAAFAVIPVAVLIGWLPAGSLWTLLLLPLLGVGYLGARGYAGSPASLHAAMVCNVLCNLLAPLALMSSLIL